MKRIASYALLVCLAACLSGAVILTCRSPHSGHLLPYSQVWFGVLGMAFLTGYVDTCVGGGHGTLLTPILILLGFPASMAVPAILLSEIGIGILATIMNHRAGNIQLAHGEQHRRVLFLLAGCSFVGSFLAVAASLKLPARAVNLYIGFVIVAVGLLLLTKRSIFRKFSMKRIAVLGVVAAFNKGISGGGYGPLLTSGQILSGVCEKGAVSITPPARGLTGLIAVTMYFAAKGSLDATLALPLIAGSLLAIPVAVATVAAVDAALLRRGVVAVTLVLGAMLVVKALL